MLHGLVDWWNGVELWMLGLPFPFQFALVIVVLVPLCLVVAWLIDRIVDHASALMRSPEPPLDLAAPVDKTEDEVAETVADEPTVEGEPPADERVPVETTGG